MVGVLKVNVFQAERIIPTITICKVVAVTIEQKSVSKSVIVILSACIAQIGDNAVYLGGGQMHPDHNIFRCVNQFVMEQGRENRRPDIPSYRQCTIFQQCRNIPHIARANLCMGIGI